MEWKTSGFDGFSKGVLGNGGQNLYISKNGILQRIFLFDVNNDGYPDLLFANSQSMDERPPVFVYNNLPEDTSYAELPSNGTYDATLADLTGSGFLDLIIACQNNGTHSDTTGIIYYNGHEGYSEKYKIELPAPDSVGVCAGDYNGDGKMDLAFISENKLRVFYQYANGFSAANFIDYPISIQSAAAADIDGDGFCDLYFTDKYGNTGVLFGGENGFDIKNLIWIETFGEIKPANNDLSSTAGRRPSYHGWRPSIVNINNTNYLFYAKDGRPVFYTCGADRTLKHAFSFDCGGVVAAAAADFTGNGYSDVAFAVFGGKNEVCDCLVYFGSPSGFSDESILKLPVKGAHNLTAADIDGTCLIVCRSGESAELTVQSPIFKVTEKGAIEITSVMSGDCMGILAGKNTHNDKWQIVVPNHEMNRAQGQENIYVYLGGADGYKPDRKIELQGHSAVLGFICDFNDDGLADIFVGNCFENAPHLDDGSYIYINDGDGFAESNKWILPTVRCHGAAIGDFRKTGYLDIACGGFNNRELRIFHRSEHGYSYENSTRILLGPDGGYTPPRFAFETDIGQYPYEKDDIQYGEPRWLLAADFNNNGWLDLFVSQISGEKCFIFWGGPEGFSKSRMTELLTDGVAAANAADFNGNGYLDLILAGHQSTKKGVIYDSYITIYWGGPEGYKENRKMQLPAHCANSVTAGDYNNNGCLDIYATAYNNGRERDIYSYVYKNVNGGFSVNNMQMLFNHSGCGCISGDFNGDGYTDLAVACHKEYGDHCSRSFIFWGGPDGLSDERKTILPTFGPHGMITVNPGNIKDRSDKEYYVSVIKKIPDGLYVKKIQYEGECTSTSWVECEMRRAEDENGIDTAKWTPIPVDKDISAYDIKGYVQYRLALCAKCGCGTPRISSVTVVYG